MNEIFDELVKKPHLRPVVIIYDKKSEPLVMHLTTKMYVECVDWLSNVFTFLRQNTKVDKQITQKMLDFYSQGYLTKTFMNKTAKQVVFSDNDNSKEKAIYNVDYIYLFKKGDDFYFTMFNKSIVSNVI